MVVTGGGRDIGRGIARAMAKAGGNLVITGRSAAPLADTEQELRGLDAKTLAAEGAWVVVADIERGGGASVNQSSASAQTSGNGSYYGLAKQGVNGLTIELASELGKHNIRVNGIAPGTDCAAMREQDQARAALFLLSDDAAWITGQTLCADGGQLRRV